MTEPEWLPEPASVDGTREAVISRLYEIFNAGFKRDGCVFEGASVRWDGRILAGEAYEEGFWHLISRVENKTGIRRFDPRRAERLPWCKPVIDNAADAAVTVWRYRAPRKDRQRIYLWLEEQDYVIVLDEDVMQMVKSTFIVTAFYVDGKATQRDLRKRYRNRIE